MYKQLLLVLVSSVDTICQYCTVLDVVAVLQTEDPLDETLPQATISDGRTGAWGHSPHYSNVPIWGCSTRPLFAQESTNRSKNRKFCSALDFPARFFNPYPVLHFEIVSDPTAIGSCISCTHVNSNHTQS